VASEKGSKFPVGRGVTSSTNAVLGYGVLCFFEPIEVCRFARSMNEKLYVMNTTPKAEILFYDGHCGLCHRAVRFVLVEDRDGTLFRFAPLQGETFQGLVTLEQQKTLPDSVVVMTADGKLLARSDAFLHILRRLGGGWRVLAGALSIAPRGLRDFVYDCVARVRYRIFGRRDDLCPVMPPELRRRFDS
jgi:predicted DCC family thiol-disulfide oxidoreductase YuxK